MKIISSSLMCSLPAISFCLSQRCENELELPRREAAALMSELLRGHFPTGLEKDYTVAGNSRGRWFSNPFYSAFVSAFSCVLPLGWAKHKSVLTSLLISMHETNISREGIGTERQQSISIAWGGKQEVGSSAVWHMGPVRRRLLKPVHGAVSRCCLQGGAWDTGSQKQV